MSQSAADAADDADDEEWRFAVDDVGPEAEPATPEPDPIEPESISPEHAVFVALGVLLTVAVIATGL